MMQLEISLTPEQQTALVRLAQSAGKDVEQYLSDLVRSEVTIDLDSQIPEDLDSSEFRRRLEAIAVSHPGHGNVDCSREAIYGDDH